MQPFAGLNKRKRKTPQQEQAPPPAPEPSPPPAPSSRRKDPPSSRRKDPQRTARAHNREESEEQDIPEKKHIRKKGIPSDDEDDIASEPEAAPPPPEPKAVKQIYYNRDVINSYRALDHKAL